MTPPGDHPLRVVDTVEDAIRSLRESGFRLSTARRLVLEALYAGDGPVTASHLWRELSLEESSVYRNLELLEAHGLVRHLHLGQSPGLYVLAHAEDLEYLYCERCDKLTAVTPQRLDPVRKQIRLEFGYTPRFSHLPIMGICEDCAVSAGRPGSPSPSADIGTGRSWSASCEG